MNQSKKLVFFCFKGKNMGGQLNLQRKQISEGVGHQENGSGLWKPRLPRAALDSTIWREVLQKSVKFAQLGPNQETGFHILNRHSKVLSLGDCFPLVLLKYSLGVCMIYIFYIIEMLYCPIHTHLILFADVFQKQKNVMED